MSSKGWNALRMHQQEKENKTTKEEKKDNEGKQEGKENHLQRQAQSGRIYDYPAYVPVENSERESYHEAKKGVTTIPWRERYSGGL